MAVPWSLSFSSWLLVLDSLRERNCGAFVVGSCFSQQVGQRRKIPPKTRQLVMRSTTQRALCLRWTQLGLSLWLQSGPQVTLAEEVVRHKYFADSCLCAQLSLPSSLVPSSTFFLGPPLCSHTADGHGHRRDGAQCQPPSCQGRKMLLGNYADTLS